MPIFFDYPLNYGGDRSAYPEVSDNDYATYTEQSRIMLHIDSIGDGTGAASPFTNIFVKGTGITSYQLRVVGRTATPTIVMPKTVTNDSGDTVETTVDGYQHVLNNFWQDESVAKPTAQSLELIITGAGARVYQALALNRILTINANGGFSRIEYDSLELGADQEDMNGRLSYIPPINNERDKWIVHYTALSRRVTGVRSDGKAFSTRDILADEITHFRRKYKNFTFAPEYERHPERVFPSVWHGRTTQVRYRSRWKGGGRRVRFSVREA